VLVKLSFHGVDLWNKRWHSVRTILLKDDKLLLRSWLGQSRVTPQYHRTAQLLLHSQSVSGSYWIHFSFRNCLWLIDYNPFGRLIWKKTNLFNRFIALTSYDDRFNLLQKCLLRLCLPVHNWHFRHHALLYWLHL
jgi:hypothetical protein